MRTLSACLFCVCVSLGSSALAQVDTPPQPTPPRPTGGVSPAPAAGPGEPVMPVVDDPMLVPLETPGSVLGSWQQALALVRTRSTSVATAQAQIAQAQARSRQALANSLPDISGNGSVRRSLLFGTGAQFTEAGPQANVRIPSPATVWQAGISLRQSILDLRSWHDTGTARKAEQVATLSAEDTERLTLGALADTIVTVVTAERLAEVTRVSLRSNLSTLDLTKKRMTLGAASAVDVLRTDQEVASTRADVVQADEAVRQAREALGLALGYSEAWGLTADINLDQLGADARASCAPIQDPDQRSDVRAARLNVEVNERNVDSASFGHAPTLDVVSDFGYTSAPQSARPVQWSIGAVLSVPIYDGGRLGSERGLNVATANIARQQLTEATRRARLEATQAQRSVQVAGASFSVSRQARDIAAESARLSKIAFVHGTGTSFDLVDSAQRLRLAEIDVTIKEFEVVRARITALLALSNCSI